jgi:hypothetical protein
LYPIIKFSPSSDYGRESQKFFANPLASPQGPISHNGSSLALQGGVVDFFDKRFGKPTPFLHFRVSELD